jgi:hypothetical protein
MPEALPGREHHLDRYHHFIWSRLFRELPKDSYVERHHIVPKSVGMNRDHYSQPWNSIKLTSKEHFIAHMMLWKAFGGKMTFAFQRFSTFNLSKNSKLYERMVNDLKFLRQSNTFSKKISKSIAEKWKDPVYREKCLLARKTQKPRNVKRKGKDSPLYGRPTTGKTSKGYKRDPESCLKQKKTCQIKRELRENARERS